MPSYSREVKIPGKSSQELYEVVAKEIDRFLEKTGIGKFDIERDAAAKRVTAKHSMATAVLNCQEGCLKLDAKLSLLAAPFRSKIDEAIDRWVKKTFQL